MQTATKITRTDRRPLALCVERARTPHIHVTPEAQADRLHTVTALVSLPLPLGWYALPPVERERELRRAFETACDVAVEQVIGA